MFSGHGGPGHEVADGIGVMTSGEARERVGQPGRRIDAVEFAALDERGDDGPVVAAFVGAGEQGVFAVQRED